MLQKSHSIISRNTLILAIGLIVGSGLLWLSLKDTDFGNVYKIFTNEIKFIYAIPFVAFLLLFIWLKAYRWGYLLSNSITGSNYDRFASVLIGYTGNLLLPAQLGELVRIYVLVNRAGTPTVHALTSIALERVLDLCAMLLLLVIAILIGEQIPAWMQTLGYGLLALICLGLFFAYLYLSRTSVLLSGLQYLLKPLPDAWQLKLLKWFEQGTVGFAILKQPVVLIKSTLISAVIWLVMACCAWLAMIAAGINLPFSAAILMLVVLIGGMMLPASPGFIGTIQFCFVLVLGHYHIANDQAIAASIFYHVLISLPILIISYPIILKMGYNARQLRQGASTIDEGAE